MQDLPTLATKLQEFAKKKGLSAGFTITASDPHTIIAYMGKVTAEGKTVEEALSNLVEKLPEAYGWKKGRD